MGHSLGTGVNNRHRCCTGRCCAAGLVVGHGHGSDGAERVVTDLRCVRTREDASRRADIERVRELSSFLPPSDFAADTTPLLTLFTTGAKTLFISLSNPPIPLPLCKTWPPENLRDISISLESYSYNFLVTHLSNLIKVYKTYKNA